MNNDKILIETYHGHEIHYDVDDNKFTSSIEIADNVKTTKRQSLKDVRHEIDLFIKANVEFKPFKIVMLNSWSSNTDIYPRMVTALRTDGKLVIEDITDRSYKNKSLYGAKSISKMYAYDEDIMKQKKEVDDELNRCRADHTYKSQQLIARLKPADFDQYLPILSPEE